MRRTPDVGFLPDSVAGFVIEAWEVRSVNAFRAVLLLARSVIEAAAKSKNVTDGSLVTKIKKLVDDGHLRPGVQAVADAIRVLGNDIAHGDLTDPPTEEDADDVLQLLTWVLEDVYKTSGITEDIVKRQKARATRTRSEAE